MSGEGLMVAFSGHMCLEQLFAPEHCFIDHVHVNDRIAVLTFFDSLRRRGNAAPAAFRLRNQSGLIDSCILTPGHGMPDGAVRFFIKAETNGCDVLLPAERGAGGLNGDVSPLAAAAHEMRMPLNAIIGFSDFLLHELKGQFDHEGQRDYVMLIKKSGEHLLEMITHMLGAAQCDCPGRAQYNDIAGIVRECTAIMGSLLSARHITVHMKGAQNLYAAAHDIEVRQIVINLLANAIKYTGHDGRINLNVSVNGKKRVIISVADNGIGISREQLAQIGMPFRRTKNAIESSAEGNGLGLALVYRIAVFYGGRVRIKSREGKGTHISVSLPLLQRHAGAGWNRQVERNAGCRQSGTRGSFPHLIPVTERENHNGMKVHNIDNGKQEKEILKSA